MYLAISGSDRIEFSCPLNFFYLIEQGMTTSDALESQKVAFYRFFFYLILHDLALLDLMCSRCASDGVSE